MYADSPACVDLNVCEEPLFSLPRNCNIHLVHDKEMFMSSLVYHKAVQCWCLLHFSASYQNDASTEKVKKMFYI